MKITDAQIINGKLSPDVSLEGVEELDFSSCSSLETAPNIPVGVKKINFSECSNLKIVPPLPEGIEELDFFSCSNLETVLNIPAGVKKVDFSWCTNLKTVPTIPEGLEELSFSGCSNLETVPNIPAGVKKINFSGCHNLKTVPTLPEGIEELDCSICPSLEIFPNIPSGVKIINLSRCSKLTIPPSQLAQLFALEESGCVVSYPSQFNRNDQVAQAKSRLEEIGKKYKEANSLEAENPIYSTTTLLHRFLNESTGQRGGVREVVLSTVPILDILEKNPNRLKWVEEISAVFLDACVNQPVAGWSEISAWAAIAETEKMSEKLVAAKHLLVNDQIKDFVARTFLNHPGVEVEAGNSLLREIHKKLLDEGEILKPWVGIPGPVAYEGSVRDWLTKERVQEFHDQIKPILQKDSRQLAEFLLEGVHGKTWGEVNFSESLARIQEDRQKRWTEIEGMPDGTKKEELAAGFEKANLEREMSEIKALTSEALERELGQVESRLVNRPRDQVSTAPNENTSPRAARRLNQALRYQASEESGR